METIEYKTSANGQDPTVKAMKCDLCVEVGSPACVRACPTDALHRLSFEGIFRKQASTQPALRALEPIYLEEETTPENLGLEIAKAKNYQFFENP